MRFFLRRPGQGPRGGDGGRADVTADVENKAVTGVDGGRGEGGGEGGGDGGGGDGGDGDGGGGNCGGGEVMAEAGTAVVTAALVGRCGLVSGGAGPGGGSNGGGGEAVVVTAAAVKAATQAACACGTAVTERGRGWGG